MRVLILTAALALVSPMVLAEDGKDSNLCNAADDTPEAAVISDCTRLLDSGKPDQVERANLYYSRGAAHWRNREYDAAINDENEALRINPILSDAYMRRGAAYFGKGDYDRSIADSTKAIEIDPVNVRAFSNRAIARQRKVDRLGAIADETKAIEIDPQFVAAYLIR